MTMPGTRGRLAVLFAVALAPSAATSLLSGLCPAWTAATERPVEALRT